ncbi:hypothetical protein AB0I88_33605, partial [Actinoplanes sp. NPDC049802]
VAGIRETAAQLPGRVELGYTSGAGPRVPDVVTNSTRWFSHAAGGAERPKLPGDLRAQRPGGVLPSEDRHPDGGADITAGGRARRPKLPGDLRAQRPGGALPSEDRHPDGGADITAEPITHRARQSRMPGRIDLCV